MSTFMSAHFELQAGGVTALLSFRLNGEVGLILTFFFILTQLVKVNDVFGGATVS